MGISIFLRYWEHRVITTIVLEYDHLNAQFSPTYFVETYKIATPQLPWQLYEAALNNDRPIMVTAGVMVRGVMYLNQDYLGMVTQ